ncbi:MAG: peptidoglycan DD-metalloendopeptidase family protein [Gammaproteobacteria bacterium]|nr:peptidoglycan DD-metalloendopeptidase family protein [Gammaproteobacteria bacterium]
MSTPANAAETGRSITTVTEYGHAIAAIDAVVDPHSSAVARAAGSDGDGDGVPDYADNCSVVFNPNQYDSNGDGYGNDCDGDINNDGLTNFIDLNLLKSAFFSSPGAPGWNPDADMNGDLAINFIDLQMMKNMFFAPVGPSGMSCAGTPPCPDPVFLFEWPMPGVDANDWVINNYVDLAPGASIVDYMGGAKSYNGHKGVDIDVPTFREMDNNFPILAVAEGTVLALEESNFDRNTSCVGQWNFVTIGHPNGWRTIYGHLKMNSVVVTVGDTVEAGDVLGVVGSSGCSTQPHLHLETLDPDGIVVSPFLNGMWSAPPVYNTPLGFMDATLYNTPINSVNMIKDPADNAEIVPPGNTFGIGLSMAGGGPGDTINIRILKGGTLVAQNNFTFNQVYRHTYWWWNYTFAANASGAHTLQVRTNGSLQYSYPFNVAPIFNGFWQVRHGVPASSYQQLFDDMVANGYRPIWVDGYDVNGATYFNAIYNQSNVASWAAAHGMSNTQYQNFFNTQTGAGRRLINVDTYLQNGQVRHAAVFAQQTGTQWVAYHSVSTATHQANFNNFIAQGFRPVVISTVQAGGNQVWTAFYDKTPVGSFVALANLTSAQYQTEFTNQANAGRELRYLNGYTLNGTNRFSAIWISNGPTSWVGQHNLTSSQWQAAFDQWTNAGLITRIVTGYERNNIHNFAGMWSN